MSKIGVIAITQSIMDTAANVIAELGLEQKTVLRLGKGSMESGLALAREFAAAGVEVIVTRGGTGEIIRNSEVNLPLVEIPVGPREFIAAIETARRLTGKRDPAMAALAFRSMSYSIQVFARLSGIDIKLYEYDGTSVENVVDRARAEGIEVILGGDISAGMANRKGMHGVVLGSSEESIRSALVEAEKVAVSRRLEEARLRRMQLVLDLIPDGVIAVDRDGIIRLVNPSACRLLGFTLDPLGQKAEEVMPFLDLGECLQIGEPSLNNLVPFKNSALVVSARPVMVEDEVAGAVISFQEADSIRKLDEKINNEFYAKGLVAGHYFSDAIGDSKAMRDAIKKAKVYAATRGTVLITGETGTGKELFAQSIHNASPCRNGPFVAVNCAALPPSLLESELFGYEEGAFTGAVRHGKPGYFELANNGSIFLDEISEMDRFGQARLLRVLQEKRSMRVGGSRYLPLNIRVIAASNRDLKDMVGRGEFRGDLYYRLTALILHLPPLRERREDIPRLVDVFATGALGKFGNEPYFSPEAIECLKDYSWPGNVRELQNVVERLCLFYENRPITAAEVTGAYESEAWSTPQIAEADTDSQPDTSGLSERETIRRALTGAQGNQRRAAAILGIDPSTLYRKMRRYGIRKTITDE